MGMSSILAKKLAFGAYRSASLATLAVLRVNVCPIRLRLNHCMLRRYHLRSAPIAILEGVSRSADLARLAEPSFDVLVYAFERLRCALRRHHLFSIPIAILGGYR